MKRVALLVVLGHLALAKISIKRLSVLSEVQSLFATTDLITVIENKGSNASEVLFTTELPEDAFIKSFYVERDGRVAYGVIKPKEEAEVDFNDAKEKGNTAAHLRKTNDRIFELRVNLAGHSSATFNLTYQEILRRTNFMYKHVVNIRANYTIEHLEVNTLLADKHNFTKIFVPEFQPGIGVLPVSELLKKPEEKRVKVEAANDEQGSIALVSYSTENVDQGELVILFNSSYVPGSSEVQVINGYFLQSFNPPEEIRVANKTTIFVLDKSGSMEGQKLAQLKQAMIGVLDDIGGNDRVNIIAFDREVLTWKNEPVTLDSESKKEALEFVNDLEAKGGTYYANALSHAMEMLSESEKRNPTFMPSILFLTDGRPTIGAKTYNELTSELTVKNMNFTINSISFGNDADYKLLKRISGLQKGVARRIFENADAGVQIAGFYHELAYPLLKHLKISYLDESVDLGSVVSSADESFFYPGDDFFQLGRLDKSAKTVNQSTVHLEDNRGSHTINSSPTTVGSCYDSTLFKNFSSIEARSIILCGRDGSAGNFIERMWSHMTVRKYESILATSAQTEEEQRNVAAQIKRLSLQYGFVTSQTSMVVVLENEEHDLEELEYEEDYFERDKTQGETASLSKQGSELDSRFRTPFIASKEIFSGDCRIEVIALMDTVASRSVNKLRLSRLFSRLLRSHPPNVTFTHGMIGKNRSISIGEGNEEALFQLVATRRGTRQYLIILSEMIESFERLVQYLRILAPSFNKIVIAKTFSELKPLEFKQFQYIKSAKFVGDIQQPDDVLKHITC